MSTPAPASVLAPKPHYAALDGLRGVAAVMVVLFHMFEGNARDFQFHTDQIINHGYLSVDFFFMLSGFVIGYAYDDRWEKMNLWNFCKRRLVRLQPMVVMGMLLGGILFYFQGSEIFPNLAQTPVTDKPRMVILTSAGGILQLLYWVLAFRSKAPIFSPALFRIRNFAIGIAGNIVCRLGGSCLPYLMPLFFQVVLGYSALRSGMSLIPLALSNLLAKTVAPRLLGKFGYRNIMVVNTFTIGTLLASFHFVGPGIHELILLGMLALLGGANSIQFTCMNTLTLIDLPNADASSGNSLLSTIIQLSIAVSIAAASLLLDSFGGHSATSGKAVETAFHATFATIGAIAAASSFIFALVDKDKGITRKRRKAA